jgi:hypothetical protein
MTNMDEKPPIFPCWSYWYALVILLLFAEIIFFYLISK